MQSVTLDSNQHWAQLSPQFEIVLPKHTAFEFLTSCRTEVAWVICVLLVCITVAFVVSRVIREQERERWTAVEAELASLRRIVEEVTNDEA